MFLLDGAQSQVMAIRLSMQTAQQSLSLATQLFTLNGTRYTPSPTMRIPVLEQFQQVLIH